MRSKFLRLTKVLWSSKSHRLGSWTLSHLRSKSNRNRPKQIKHKLSSTKNLLVNLKRMNPKLSATATVQSPTTTWSSLAISATSGSTGSALASLCVSGSSSRTMRGSSGSVNSAKKLLSQSGPLCPKSYQNPSMLRLKNRAPIAWNKKSQRPKSLTLFWKVCKKNQTLSSGNRSKSKPSKRSANSISWRRNLNKKRSNLCQLQRGELQNRSQIRSSFIENESKNHFKNLNQK